MYDEVEFSLLMPCLNEANTIASCVKKAVQSLNRLNLKGEVLVADNGSHDGSQAIAALNGAKVISVETKGYGSALMQGIQEARGKWIIMADADESYDWNHIDPFVEKLRSGYDFVMGCRLPSGGGAIIPGAMPHLHRYIGNPVLSFIGRLFFGSSIKDFHCGMRGFNKDEIIKLELRTIGMEFASEMVVKATLAGLRIDQVPITLYPDGRKGPPHLRTFKDGWRHLRFMLLYSPSWLFLYPGIGIFLIGLVMYCTLLIGPFKFGTVVFDVNTMLVSSLIILVGYQVIGFWFVARSYSLVEKFLTDRKIITKLFNFIKLETGLGFGLIFLLIGLGLFIYAVFYWQKHNFGPLPIQLSVRIVSSSLTLIALGLQTIFLSFILSFIGLKRK